LGLLLNYRPIHWGGLCEWLLLAYLPRGSRGIIEGRRLQSRETLSRYKP
jgi:hypothetical protein